MQALLNGDYHMIKWFRSCTVCDDGRVRFDIQWKGKPAPSTVCCHDLNLSARIEVAGYCLSLIFHFCVQAQRHFGIELPTNDDPFVMDVQLLPGTSPPTYVVHYSDGMFSDPLHFEELDGISRLIVEQHQASLAARKPKGKPRKRRRAKISASAALRDLQKNRDSAAKSKQAQKKKQSADVGPQRRAPRKKRPKTFAAFGSAEDMEKLWTTIDADWREDREDHADDLEQFPQIPGNARVRVSLHKWRELISAPTITMATCAVCAERTFASRVQTFALRGSHQPNKPVLGPAVLQTMRDKLQHQSHMPSHLDGPLPSGRTNANFVA